MSCSLCLHGYLLFTLSLRNIVESVPLEYCNSPLNTSDCNLEPKQVFSYYKPGSRCELETWRGCPTVNLFDNEYRCIQHCVFRMSLIVYQPYREPMEEQDVKQKLEEQDPKQTLEEIALQPLQELHQLLKLIVEEEVQTDSLTEEVNKTVAQDVNENFIDLLTTTVAEEDYESETEDVTEDFTEVVSTSIADDLETETVIVTEDFTEVVSTTTAEEDHESKIEDVTEAVSTATTEEDHESDFEDVTEAVSTDTTEEDHESDIEDVTEAVSTDTTEEDHESDIEGHVEDPEAVDNKPESLKAPDYEEVLVP